MVIGSHGRVARHRSAKPSTTVRICLRPHKLKTLNNVKGFLGIKI